MKVVLDTNVLVSGLITPPGVPGRIVGSWRDGGFELVLSERQLEEIEAVLRYPKIARRLSWGSEEIQRFILLLRLKSEIVALPVAADVFEGLRDPADAHLLSALRRSGAEVLVSGDQHLLELRARFPVLSPVEFAARL
ncbi:MAG: putative toxin-antitoxin system toxin component, PIN family [Thermoleophilia bacterium]|nr:putative toxin-antitoxin system toxin component, PIN family [Thermoleophilia bacterium]